MSISSFPSDRRPLNDDLKIPLDDLSKKSEKGSSLETEENPLPNEETTPKPEENPPKPEEAEKRAGELAQWAITRAKLLDKLETKSSQNSNQPQTNRRPPIPTPDQRANPPFDQTTIDRNEAKHAEAEQFQERTGVYTGVDATNEVHDTTLGLVRAANQLGVEMDAPALSGANYFGMVGNELFAGFKCMGEKYELCTLKAKREEIEQKINSLPQGHAAIGLLKAQKAQLDAQISQQEGNLNKSIIGFIGVHLKNSLMSVMEVLGHSTDAAAGTAALSGAAAIGSLMMVGGSVGAAMNAKEHGDIDNQIVNIERISEKHKNPKISNAISAVKAAAIDRAANHKKRNIEIGIFQNGFTIYNGAVMTAAMLLGLIVGPAAIAILGTALPVVTGLGLLIGGGVALYKNRHTVGRGLKQLVAPNKRDVLERLSPHRNLKFRQWRKQVELKDTVKKLDKLAAEYVRIDPTKTDEIKTKDEEIKKIAAKVIELSDEIEKIRYDRATQTLRDETGSLAQANKARSKAIDYAVGDVIDEVKELNGKIERLKTPKTDEIKELESKIARLDSSDPNERLAAYKELKADQLKLAKQSLNKIEAEINKEPIDLFKAIYQKKIKAKEDELKNLDPTNLQEIYMLKKEIADLNGRYRDVVALHIASSLNIPLDLKSFNFLLTALEETLPEKKRLEQLQDKIKARVVALNNPTDETIESFKNAHIIKLSELKREAKKEAYLEFKAEQIKEAEEQLEKLDAEIKRLEGVGSVFHAFSSIFEKITGLQLAEFLPSTNEFNRVTGHLLSGESDALIKQFKAVFDKKIKDKKDQLHLLPPNKTEEIEVLEKEIKELEKLSKDIPARIQEEKERLVKVRAELSENINKIKNPTDEMINSLIDAHEKKVKELKETGNALLAKRSTPISSAEALMRTIGDADSMEFMSSSEIINEMKVLDAKIERLAFNRAPTNDIFREFRAEQIKESEQQLKQLDAEIEKVQKHFDDENTKQSKAIKAKNDQLKKLGLDKTDERGKLIAEIAELRKNLNSKLGKIQEVKDKLIALREKKQENINKDKEAPTDEKIQALKAVYEDRVKAGKALLEKREKLKKGELDESSASSSEANAPPTTASAKALVHAISADTMSRAELDEFVAACKTSFPGVDFDEFDTAHDKHMYVQTQIQNAIAKESLF